MSSTPAFPYDPDLSDIDFDFEPDDLAEAGDSLAPAEPGEALELIEPLPDIYSLLPMPHIELTVAEKAVVQQYQLGRIILGPVADAVMDCPPPPPEFIPVGQVQASADGQVTYVTLRDSFKICPFRTTCPFLKQGKAPHEQPCPLETNYLTERFVRWAAEMGKTPHNINETERVHISELVAGELHERRHLSILSESEAARGVDISLKETDSQGNPIAWEKVIHISQQSLVGIRATRKQVMKMFELTPEAKTRKAKYEGGLKGADLSSIQSARSGQLARALVIDQD